MKRAIILVVVGFFLAGCASAPAPAAPPADGATYNTVEALRIAYESAGGSCDEWQQHNAVDAAAESGACDSGTVLSTYTSQGDRDIVVDNVKSLAGLFDGGISLLVGANWIINSDDVADVQPVLGGTLVSK